MDNKEHKSDLEKKREGLWCDFCGKSHPGSCQKVSTPPAPQEHFLDSRTPEEKAENSKIESITTTSQESKGWEEEFNKTMLITKAGAWLECSDYEGVVDEIKQFIRSVEKQARTDERKRIREFVETIREAGEKQNIDESRWEMNRRSILGMILKFLSPEEQ